MENNPEDESLDHHYSCSNTIILNKSSSFHAHRPKPRLLPRAFSSLQQPSSVKDHDPLTHLDEVDAFIHDLSDKDHAPREIPNLIDTFVAAVQSQVDKYDSGLKFGQDSLQDTLVINGISRISKMVNLLQKLPSNNKRTGLSLILMTLVLQRTMSIMEEDFRIFLEDVINTESPSDKEKAREDETSVYPSGINQEMMRNMKMIACSMISSGYEIECELAFIRLRRMAMKKEIKEQGMQKVSMDELQKMEWEALEVHISSWVKVVKKLTQVVLPAEKRLCQFIFSSHPLMVEQVVANVVMSVTILFTTFAEAISMTKRSAERLFKVLDVYEAMTHLNSSMDDGSLSAHDLCSEISSVKHRLGEAAFCIFCDLENSIKNDAATAPVPNGAVHPLTRYTMNYLRYACDFKHSLEELFTLHRMTEQRLGHLEPRRSDDNNVDQSSSVASSSQLSAFALELMNIMNLLDVNLEEKSKHYKDSALRCIFLMNNGRYMMQKIKESGEISEVVDNDFRRRKSSEVRGYHKRYQRETWGRALQCLNPEGLQLNGKVQKPVLKERFKSFNQIFDEIQRTQSCWVVSDEQLQSELQVSISAVMIPAYRSFLARFGQVFYPGRQYEKYVKYQPEDIESTIEGLFDGLSMPKRG